MVDSPPAKRPRGRPPGSGKKKTVKPELSGPKRGRGRPPKAAQAEAAKAPLAAAEAEAAKAVEGSGEVKRGRGRPPKAARPAPPAGDAAEAPTPKRGRPPLSPEAKRPRGRPPKVKPGAGPKQNKMGLGVAVGSGVKKRGRPPKALVPAAPPSPRGRFRSVGEVQSNPDTPAGNIDFTIPPVPAPAKRGRPPKNARPPPAAAPAGGKPSQPRAGPSAGPSVVAGSDAAPQVVKEEWGEVDGTTVHLYTLKNSSGAYVRCMPWGATVVGIHVPDRDGVLRDVALGFDSLEEYLTKPNPCFGSVPGRVANRISGGKFKLDGKTYVLDKNEGGHTHIHGGKTGFHRRLWQCLQETATAKEAGVTFVYSSQHMEEGYPGALNCCVSYTWTEDNELRVEFTGEVPGEGATVVNLTNHTYFNLHGEDQGRDVNSHRLRMKCSKYTPFDKGHLPTGDIALVSGTPYDFTAAKPIGRDIPMVEAEGTSAYNVNYIVDKDQFLTASHTLVNCATVSEPATGIQLECHTTQPGVQLFTAFEDVVAGIVGKGQREYGCYAGICLETQHFPDSVNHPKIFPSTVLRAGERYYHRTHYKFSTI